jgi:hypothetical protein
MLPKLTGADERNPRVWTTSVAPATPAVHGGGRDEVCRDRSLPGWIAPYKIASRRMAARRRCCEVREFPRGGIRLALPRLSGKIVDSA